MKQLNGLIILYTIVFILSILGIVLIPIYGFQPYFKPQSIGWSFLQSLQCIGTLVIFGGAIYGIFKSVYELHEQLDFNTSYTSSLDLYTSKFHELDTRWELQVGINDDCKERLDLHAQQIQDYINNLNKPE